MIQRRAFISLLDGAAAWLLAAKAPCDERWLKSTRHFFCDTQRAQA